jgi:hypothetical protein
LRIFSTTADYADIADKICEVVMLSEAKHLWTLRFRVVGTTCSEILRFAQNDNEKQVLIRFIREIRG